MTNSFNSIPTTYHDINTKRIQFDRSIRDLEKEVDHINSASKTSDHSEWSFRKTYILEREERKDKQKTARL